MLAMIATHVMLIHAHYTLHTTHAHTTCTRTVDLPSSPLQTEAPQLEHIGKSRPKPARLQKGKGKGKGGTRKQHKPSYLSKAKDEVDIGMPTTTLSLFLSLPLSL